MARQPWYTPVRRNHVIAPFGVGSIFRSRNGISVVMCGLGEWLTKRPTSNPAWLDEGRIVDGFLEGTLGVPRLIEPPALADEPNYLNTWFLPVARFPTFEHCTNPKCRSIVRRSPDEVSQTSCQTCAPAKGRGRWPSLQIPLVLTCRAGHLTDVPWTELVHDARLHTGFEEDEHQRPAATVACANPRLRYTVSANVAYPRVTCESCGSTITVGPGRSLPIACPGERAWLPNSDPQPCRERPSILERSASNLYFPDVRSSLYIPSGPELNHRLLRFFEEPVAFRLLDERRVAGVELDDRDHRELARNARARGIDATEEDVARHLDAAQAPPPNPELERSRELDALLAGVEQTSTGAGFAPLIARPLDLDRFESALLRGAGRIVSSVTAVDRLAETRVLAGFTRFRAGRVRPDEGFEMLWGSRPGLADDRDWLPAHRTYGEGILILLDPRRVDAWEEATRTSGAHYRDGIDTGFALIEPREILAHTLAHLLIRQVAATCGYALPALRERLYVDVDDTQTSRTGFLLYTADGDSYGTLGGLVELATPGRLEQLLDAALESARWCGADPICMDPPDGIRLHTTPGSCHHCLLLPETSCELFNQGLDRASVIGRAATPGFQTSVADE